MNRYVDVGVTVALVTGLVFAFADPLLGMTRLWANSPMYSYGYTVPLISLYLLWSRGEQFRERAIAPAKLAGGALLAIALVAAALGQLAAVQVVQQLAFLVAIVGIVLFLFGVNYLIIAAPAIAYLLFMVPLWDAFTDRLHWPFQNQSARLGTALMHAVGVPALRDGTFIALPNVLIEVARECSGVNYLVAVFALALPLSILRLHSMWRRVVLMAGALLIAALANGLRVALIGVLAYYEIGTPLHGPFHILQGLFVSAVGYVALFIGLRILQDDGPRDAEATTPQPVAGRSWNQRWRLVDACSLAAVFWLIVFVGLAPGATPVALAQPLETVPNQLGSWSMDLFAPPLAEPDPPMAAWQEADDHLRRNYTRIDGRRVTVDIWYFTMQSQRREIVGSGVADLHRLSTETNVPLAGDTSLTANLVRWPRTRQVGLFWYVLEGRNESNPYATILRSLWNVVSIGQSNGAVVMLRTPADDSDPHAVTALTDLAHELQPAFAGVWPSSTSARQLQTPQ